MVWPFIWANLNPLYPRMPCARFGWNWPSSFGEVKIRQYIFVISLLFPLENGVALHLNKFESPSPKDALCQVWLKLAKWFCRRWWKCEKFTADRRTNDGQQAIRKAHLSFQLSWAKNVTLIPQANWVEIYVHVLFKCKSTLMVQGYIVCFYVVFDVLEKFSLKWKCPNFQWRAADPGNSLMLCTHVNWTVIEQLGFFGMPHLLWHGTSVLSTESCG